MFEIVTLTMLVSMCRLNVTWESLTDCQESCWLVDLQHDTVSHNNIQICWDNPTTELWLQKEAKTRQAAMMIYFLPLITQSTF